MSLCTKLERCAPLRITIALKFHQNLQETSLKSFFIFESLNIKLQFFDGFEHGSMYVVKDVGTFASDDPPNG